MVDVEEGASVLTLRSFGLAGEEKRKKEEKEFNESLCRDFGHIPSCVRDGRCAPSSSALTGPKFVARESFLLVIMVR